MNNPALPSPSAVAAEGSIDDGLHMSWTLDNIAEIVYLSTQLQVSQQIIDACQSVSTGNSNALQVLTHHACVCSTYIHMYIHTSLIHQYLPYLC